MKPLLRRLAQACLLVFIATELWLSLGQWGQFWGWSQEQVALLCGQAAAAWYLHWEYLQSRQRAVPCRL